MDGSAATSFAERARSQISRAFAHRTCNDATAQSELFEQLLNLKFTVQPPPETQPSTPDAPPSQSSSASVDENAETKVEEEKDDGPAVTVATLTVAVPLVDDKPVELGSEQLLTEIAPEDGSLTEIDPNASQGDQQLTATAVDSQDVGESSASTDENSVVAESEISVEQVATTATISDQSIVRSHRDLGKTKDDSNGKKDAQAVTKQEDTLARTETQGLEQAQPKEAKESHASSTQHEIAIIPAEKNAQKEDCDDRRGDRREKWFEHRNEPLNESSFERPNDSSGVVSALEKSDPVTSQANEALLQPLTPSPSTSTPPVDTSIASPVAPPATLSIVSQSAQATTASSTAANSTGPESTSPVTSTPSRPVGHQSAKPSAKETVSEPGLSQQERVRVIQRIARSFNRISADGGSINLRLHPEHLGSVSVQVRLAGRSLSARLSTETTAARDAIMQDLPALRQRLADQGFDVTKFQVEVAGNGADASFAQSNGQSQYGQSDNRPSGSQTDHRRVAALRESRAATSRQLLPTTNSHWQPSSGIDLQA